MIRILCPEPSSFSNAGLEYARSRSNLTAHKMDQMEFEKEAPHYNAVLIRFNTRVGESVMQGETLQAILSPTTGLDHIDLEAARRYKIKIHHLLGQRNFLRQISATAEHTIALMLAVMRNLPQAFEAVKYGQWEPGPFRGREVAGKTLGIVGCGRLGGKVARVAKALGMKVLAVDPHVKRLPSGIERLNSLQELLALSDIVSLHVPLTDTTRRLIGSYELNQFKDGAVLINTSRGAIVDSNALLEALRSKKLSSAAIDVIDNEDQLLLTGQHPLIDYSKKEKNLIITPHIGGATFESVEKTDLFILKQYFESI